jgi:hypothetical protein
MPLAIAVSNIANVNKYTKKFITAYLLGVLSSKASFNYKYRRIVVQFPRSKRELAYLLRSQFGGSVYDRSSGRYTCFELKSKKDFNYLKKAVQQSNTVLPIDGLEELSSFLNATM